MKLTSPTTIKALLEKYGAKPSKRLGQNFLIDEHVLEKITTGANVTKKDVILEIGPGIGVLTQALAQSAQSVVAIEKDRIMVNILQETIKDHPNVKIIHEDILTLDPSPYTLNPYKVVANIPYYITSPIIRKFLEEKHQPESITLMIQREVAQRICAKPPNMSILALSVQFYATPKIIATVPRGCFWPVPNVDSAIINIVPNKDKSLPNHEAFFKIVKAGFMWPRKQLASNLANALKKDKEEVTTWLLKNNIQPAQRAETLSLQDWKNLTKN